MSRLFNDIYKGKRVLITGHTGFKGSWLSIWLCRLGANVIGYALEPPTTPNLFEVCGLENKVTSVVGDIRNLKTLKNIFEIYQPEIVFHMAAQSLVRHSYREPVETFEINVIGTVYVFEVCRKTSSIRAIVNVTSDKCYENKEWIWGYRESDPMGGHDPYSASKGCGELVTASYRRSYFPLEEYQKTHQILLASARAGNVIGGGDWGEDRLVPDVMCAASRNEKAIIRNPQAIRPWQHVLEPLAGYLLLGQRLLEGKKEFSEAWNFGPDNDGHKNVLTVVKELQSHWKSIDFEIVSDDKNAHEANFLKLDCSKVHAKLGWRPVWNSSAMFAKTAQWYREFHESGRVLSQQQLTEYISEAQQKKMSWSK